MLLFYQQGFLTFFSKCFYAGIPNAIESPVDVDSNEDSVVYLFEPTFEPPLERLLKGKGSSASVLQSTCPSIRQYAKCHALTKSSRAAKGGSSKTTTPTKPIESFLSVDPETFTDIGSSDPGNEQVKERMPKPTLALRPASASVISCIFFPSAFSKTLVVDKGVEIPWSFHCYWILCI